MISEAWLARLLTNYISIYDLSVALPKGACHELIHRRTTFKKTKPGPSFQLKNRLFACLWSKTGEPKVENSAQTASTFSPVGYLAHRLILTNIFFKTRPWPGKSHWRGKLSTVDLLVLISLEQLLLLWKYYLLIFTKQATLMRRSTVLSLPPLLVFPALTMKSNNLGWEANPVSFSSFF